MLQPPPPPHKILNQIMEKFGMKSPNQTVDIEPNSNNDIMPAESEIEIFRTTHSEQCLNLAPNQTMPKLNFSWIWKALKAQNANKNKENLIFQQSQLSCFKKNNTFFLFIFSYFNRGFKYLVPSSFYRGFRVYAQDLFITYMASFLAKDIFIFPCSSYYNHNEGLPFLLKVTDTKAA